MAGFFLLSRHISTIVFVQSRSTLKLIPYVTPRECFTNDLMKSEHDRNFYWISVGNLVLTDFGTFTFERL
jgi:hypothetical protein